MGVALIGPHWRTCSRALDCQETCTSALVSVPANVGLLEEGAGEAEEDSEKLASESAKDEEGRDSTLLAGEAAWAENDGEGRASDSARGKDVRASEPAGDEASWAPGRMQPGGPRRPPNRGWGVTHGPLWSPHCASRSCLEKTVRRG